MIEIRIDTGRTIDQETVTTTKTTAENTLLILDPRTKTSEIAQKALRIEIDAIIVDPTIVDPRTTGNIQGNANMIETIPEEGIVSRTVQDRIIEEVTVLIRINSRERNSNRVQFRESKVNGFFVDNQQDAINLNKTSLRQK